MTYMPDHKGVMALYRRILYLALPVPGPVLKPPRASHSRHGIKPVKRSRRRSAGASASRPYKAQNADEGMDKDYWLIQSSPKIVKLSSGGAPTTDHDGETHQQMRE